MFCLNLARRRSLPALRRRTNRGNSQPGPAGSKEIQEGRRHRGSGRSEAELKKALRRIFASGVSLRPVSSRLSRGGETSSTDSSSTGSIVAGRSDFEMNIVTHSRSVRPAPVKGGRSSFVKGFSGELSPNSSSSSRLAAPLYVSPLFTCPVQESVHSPGCHMSRLLLCCSRTFPPVLSTRTATAL